MAEKISAYDAPLDQLLKLGEPSFGTHEWLDYRALGIGEEQVPELMRMAVDPALLQAPQESRKTWAPVHAWRALGELRAVAAIDPLLSLFYELEDDDWSHEDLPRVFALIGPAALPALIAFLADQKADEFSRIAAGDAIRDIALLYPETASRCADALFRQLMRFEEQPEGLNAFLIMWLVDLDFTRAVSLIKLAYTFGAVDESVMGTYEEVEGILQGTDPKAREELRKSTELEVASLRKYLGD